MKEKNLKTELKALETSYRAEIKNLKADYEKQLAEMKAGYEKQISELQVKVAAEMVSSETKAVKTLATIGVPADEVPQVPKEEKTQILEQAKRLSGDGLNEFIRTNKTAIFNALKSAKKN